jgi:hypothetical protein
VNYKRAEIEAYSHAVHALNAIGHRGSLNSAHIAEAYRKQLKVVLRCVRRIIATEPDQALRSHWEEMLDTLKRLHWHIVVIEACDIGIATEMN